MTMIPISWKSVYEAYDTIRKKKLSEENLFNQAQSLFAKYMLQNTDHHKEKNGFTRMQLCRDALAAIDQQGWNRSFHQRMFHDQFIRACARVFFKTEPAGAFARAHQTILDINSWDNLAQEVLISTPRRFGKTISVSMFAAALIFSCPAIEISIYSTCKRISQKLLRNVQKFLKIIYDQLTVSPMKEVRVNMEEIVLQGSENDADVRIVNSYPSKVRYKKLILSFLILTTFSKCLGCSILWLYNIQALFPLSKMSVTNSSVSVCNAFRAFLTHENFLLCRTSFVISLTTLLKMPVGMQNSLRFLKCLFLFFLVDVNIIISGSSSVILRTYKIEKCLYTFLIICLLFTQKILVFLLAYACCLHKKYLFFYLLMLVYVSACILIRWYILN